MTYDLRGSEPNIYYQTLTLRCVISRQVWVPSLLKSWINPPPGLASEVILNPCDETVKKAVLLIDVVYVLLS